MCSKQRRVCFLVCLDVWRSVFGAKNSCCRYTNMATSYFEQPAFSPQANVVTTRPSSTALLTIDSEDRFQQGFIADSSGNVVVPASGYPLSRYILSQPNPLTYNVSPYNFTIVKNENAMNGYFTRLGLTEIVFPWTIPNINAKTSTMVVRWAAVSSPNTEFSALMTMESAYEFQSPFQIASSIESLVRLYTDLSSFVCEYGAQPNIPSFSYDSGSINYLVAFSPVAYNTAAYPYPSTTKQLFDLMGFTDYNKSLRQFAYGQSTLCQATRYVDIVCSQITYNQALKDTTTQQIARDSLCRLYLADGNGFGSNTAKCNNINFTPPGCAPFTIYRQFQTPKMINWNSAGKAYQPVPGVLKFEVFDDAGANLTEMTSSDVVESAGDYTDWSATILVSEN